MLWSLCTTPNSSTQCTPFFMVYGAEVVLPHDLRFGALRITGYEEKEAQEALEDSQDTLDENKEIALFHAAEYQRKLRTYHNSRLRTRTFNVGDLVLRLKQKKVHKLAPSGKDPSSSLKSSAAEPTA